MWKITITFSPYILFNPPMAFHRVSSRLVHMDLDLQPHLEGDHQAKLHALCLLRGNPCKTTGYLHSPEMDSFNDPCILKGKRRALQANQPHLSLHRKPHLQRFSRVDEFRYRKATIETNALWFPPGCFPDGMGRLPLKMGRGLMFTRQKWQLKVFGHCSLKNGEFMWRVCNIYSSFFQSNHMWLSNVFPLKTAKRILSPDHPWLYYMFLIHLS